MDARSEPHVVSLGDYRDVDPGWEDEFFDQLSGEFEEVRILEDGQYEVRTRAGSSARLDYEFEESQDGFGLETEIYGAESAVIRVNKYLEGRIEGRKLNA